MTLALFSQRKPKSVLPKTRSHHFFHSYPTSLRRAAGLGLGLLSLLSLSAAHAGTVNWDNTPGDWFATPTHWDNGSTPGATDDAVNNSTAAMTLGQSTTINSFFSNGAFTLSGGTFTGNQASSASTVTVNNVFTLNGGGITNFTVKQGTGGSVLFGNNGNNSIDSDVFNASVSFANDSYTRLYNTNTFNSAVNLANSSNGIQLQDSNANMVIGSAGSLVGYGNIFQNYSGSTLTNNGLINANSAANTLAVNTTNFNNAGTAEATAAGSILTLNATGTNTGTFAASNGGTVGIHGAFTSGTASQYNAAGGTILVDGGSLTGTIGSTTGTGLTFSNSGYNALSSATIDGTLTFSALDAYTRLYGVINENGAINIGTTSNGIQLQDSNTDLVIGSTGSLVGYGNIFQNYSGSNLTNNGIVNANSSGNALTINTSNFTNTKTAEATGGGILDLTNNTINSGTIAAKTGGIVNITGSLTSNTGSLIDGADGTVNVNSINLVGTLTGTAGTTLNFGNSGYNEINYGTSATVLNTDLTFNTDAYTRIYGTVTSNDTIHFNSTSNGIQLQDSNTDLINNGSLVGYGNIFQNYSGSTFTNNGTVNANSSGNALTINTSNFTNTKTAEATGGGILDLTNNTINSGTIAAKTGGIVNITGSLTSNTGSLIDGADGTVNVNSINLVGTLTGTAGTTLNFGNSGYNEINYGTSATVLNTDLTFNNDAYTRVYGATTFNNTLNLSTTTNGIQLQDSSTDLVNNGSLVGYGSVFEVYSGSTLTNNGTVDSNTLGQTLSETTSNFVNNGTAEAIKGGTLALNNNITNNGALNATGAGSLVTIVGTFTGGGSNLMTASKGGEFQINDANLLGTINTGPSTALVFNNSGGNSINGATINGNLDFAANTDAYTRIYGLDTVNGAIKIGTTSNGIQLQDSNTNLTLGSTGSLAGYGSVFEVYSGSTLTNNGTVNANSAGNTLSINTSNFSNTGTTEVQNGAALNVTSATTDSGNLLVKNGGTATFSQGVTQTAGLTQVDGTLNSPLTLSGGTLKGTGTITGNVVNNGGTVAAGDSPGTLALVGNFTQTSGGTLDVQFTNTASSLLTVSGLATLDGTLDVNYIDPAAYTGTTPFTFLDYGTLAAGTNSLGITQYFANETALTNNTGLITGHNGFTYELINNTAGNNLQLEVLTSQAPVPEASTTISFGLLLALGGVVIAAKRRRSTGV